MPSTAQPRILLLSAYDAGSHQRWREQLVASQPDFDWEVLALPPRFFRWRIRGNALTWLQEPALKAHYDLLVVTSMVDLASLKGFHPHLARTPTILYMHENQFAYPDSGRQHSSAEPKIVNLYSAVAADKVLFNSAWNRDSFLDGARRFLIEDRLFVDRETSINARCPHLLWNHRWEYDKAPDRLSLLLDSLADVGQDFRLSVVGEQFRKEPEAFGGIRERHRERIVNWGYLQSRADYDRLLGEADVAISTALHDFQGLSVLEAMASGCLALAPDRLAYPEYVPAAQRYASHADNPAAEADAAAGLLSRLIHQPPEICRPGDWRLSELQMKYYKVISATLGQQTVS